MPRNGTVAGTEAPIVGIDIGTCYARAAILDAHGGLRLAADRYGDQDIPAVVRYTMHGAQVGYYPERFLVTDWENSVEGAPRFLGRYADLPAAVLESTPFPVYEEGGRARFNLLYTTSGPEEVYTHLVRHLAGLAAATAGTPVRAVALTVPANAEDRARVSVQAALEAAGIELIRIVNAPTAALLALRRLCPGDARLREGLVALVDVGGGTTDVSIARLDASGVTILATAGDPYLGGVELRERLATGVRARFAAEDDGAMAALKGSRVGALALRRAAGETMAALTDTRHADLILDHGAGFGRDLWTDVSRRDFEGWIAPELVRLASLCGRALRMAGVSAADLGAVALAGGCARIPAVQGTIARAFGCPPDSLIVREPTALAAYGAALQAGIALGRVDERVQDVTPYPLGIAAYNAPYPGGVEVFSTVVRRGTPIPSAQPGGRGACKRTFYTRCPGQTEMSLRVLQYRGPLILPGWAEANAADNGGYDIPPESCETLGEWTLHGIAPTGRAPVNVTFDIDAHGILHLTAQEQGTRNILRQAINRW
jgi:molecular chaperone DnaK (HSP70)